MMSGKWTSTEECELIRLYGLGLTFSQMRDQSELMKKRYVGNAMSLRDKVFGLQKERVKKGAALGELSEPLKSEKYDYRNYAKLIAKGSIVVRGVKRKSVAKAVVVSGVKRKLPEKKEEEKVAGLVSFLKGLSQIDHNSRCGLLLGQGRRIEFDTSFCFVNIHQCKCKTPCTFRRHHNTWVGREEWYPFEEGECVRKGSGSCDKKKMKVRSGCKVSSDYDSEVFYKEVILRDERKSVKALEKYSKVLVKLFKDGMLNFLRCPEYMMQQLDFTAHTLKYNLYVLKQFMSSLTYSEKLLIVGYNFGCAEENISRLYTYVSEAVRLNYESQEKSSSENLKWIEWKELEGMIPLVYVSGTDQEYLSFLLMVSQGPLRNDYATLKFILKEQENHDVDMIEDNYVDFRKEIFVWNDYKTVKSYGRLEIGFKNEAIRLELMKIAHRKFLDGKNYLFETSKKVQMTRGDFGVMLNDITERWSGRRIGSQMMRKIFTSEGRKDEMSCIESKELASSLMHSVASSSNIYRKR